MGNTLFDLIKVKYLLRCSVRLNCTLESHHLWNVLPLVTNGLGFILLLTVGSYIRMPLQVLESWSSTSLYLLPLYWGIDLHRCSPGIVITDVLLDGLAVHCFSAAL